MREQTIFDLIYEPFKIDKPIRLIELFSGYGSQALALKYLGVPFEHWKTCEWAVKSIQAYKDIHFENDNNDYSASFDIDYIKEFLLKKGISSNYNEPMAKKQVDRMSENYARNVFNNIVATKNLVNIQQVKGSDLEIKYTDKYCYILTYSFPCQDLSLAGKGKGMSDTSTRSGLLWEVERILTELKEKPQMLLMENVPQVHSEDNKEDFKKWILRLEELGYKNYWQDLIATDYGIPQTRNRCFMVSILGDYSYSFPPKQPLKLKLKDLLEDNVPKKYYLSDKMLQYIVSTDKKYKVNDNNLKINRKIACVKTTGEGWTRADATDYISEQLPEEFNIKNGCKQIMDLNYYNHEQSNRVYFDGASSPSITTKSDDARGVKILIKNNNSKGYLEATEGDGIDISARMKYHRGTVQKDKSQSIKTMGGNDIGVVVNPLKGKSGKSWQFEQQVYDENGSARTLKASEGSGNIPKVVKDLRIRKLTPRECFRLMGVKDNDYEKVRKNQSDASLYHLAGDSIVVNVLMAIFKEVL